jgi:hypothetical protein
MTNKVATQCCNIVEPLHFYSKTSTPQIVEPRGVLKNVITHWWCHIHEFMASHSLIRAFVIIKNQSSMPLVKKKRKKKIIKTLVLGGSHICVKTISFSPSFSSCYEMWEPTKRLIWVLKKKMHDIHTSQFTLVR